MKFLSEKPSDKKFSRQIYWYEHTKNLYVEFGNHQDLCINKRLIKHASHQSKSEEHVRRKSLQMQIRT